LRSLGSMPPSDLSHQGSKDLLERFGPPSADCLQEPGLAKPLSNVVHRLKDAIGVKVQAVSRPQADRPLLVGVVGQADRASGRPPEWQLSPRGQGPARTGR
jgi:hypothetical protein